MKAEVCSILNNIPELSNVIELICIISLEVNLLLTEKSTSSFLRVPENVKLGVLLIFLCEEPRLLDQTTWWRNVSTVFKYTYFLDNIKNISLVFMLYIDFGSLYPFYSLLYSLFLPCPIPRPPKQKEKRGKPGTLCVIISKQLLPLRPW